MNSKLYFPAQSVALALIFFGITLADDSPLPSSKTNPDWAKTFEVDKANLVSVGTNPYFVLQPGYKLTYKSEDESLVITVLSDTKVVDGVETRIVEEREEKDGQLIEVSLNYFAIDKTTNAVYYFGEDVDIYKDGKVVSHDGAWLSGVDGAKFGMMMPGSPKQGDSFYQELAPNVAMDRCEIVATEVKFTTPAGTFEKCLRMKETSAIEEGVGYKLYALGVGLIKDGDCLLTTVEPGE